MKIRFSRTPWLVKFFLPLLIIAPLIAPVNFVIVQPGPATDLFPKLLKIKKSNATSYPADGSMYLLTIYVSNPDAKIFGIEVVSCWARPDCVVIPRSVYYDRDATTEKEEKSGKRDMKKSQSSAVLAAKALVKKYYPQVPVDQLSDSSIDVTLENTGGPSGGLIFSLGIVELLTEANLLQGRKIAATGTISPSGKVGPIGGVEEKILGAKRVGATLLFVSKENCNEVPVAVTDLQVIAVSSLDEAYKYLLEPKKANSSGVLGCTNLGA
ncbi:Peptidase S16, Lon proteolytic domain containing protein [Candidatus Nanopelagicaceae bacterium]